MEGKSCTHSGDGEIDAQILGIDEYISRVKQHRWLELITLWLPDDCVLLKKHPNFVFELDLPTLAGSVGEETKKDWARAQKNVQRGDLESAKRIMVGSASNAHMFLSGCLCLERVVPVSLFQTGRTDRRNTHLLPLSPPLIPIHRCLSRCRLCFSVSVYEIEE